jgi:hypothetical protein
MTFALAVLTVLLLSLAGSLALRRRAAAWTLVVASATWLPANNKYLEGTVLFAIGGLHGVTSSDLLAVVGFLVGLAVLVGQSQRSKPGRGVTDPAAIVYVCAVIFSSGAAAAYLSG